MGHSGALTRVVHGIQSRLSSRRVLLLVIAITLHNLPEGMAVGVGFGSIGHSPSATFANAVSLTIGIGRVGSGVRLSYTLACVGVEASGATHSTRCAFTRVTELP